MNEVVEVDDISLSTPPELDNDAAEVVASKQRNGQGRLTTQCRRITHWLSHGRV